MNLIKGTSSTAIERSTTFGTSEVAHPFLNTGRVYVAPLNTKNGNTRSKIAFWGLNPEWYSRDTKARRDSDTLARLPCLSGMRAVPRLSSYTLAFDFKADEKSRKNLSG
jgi:hypothetical protein